MGCKMPWWAGSENPPINKDKERIKELEAAFEECAEDMASWANYASDYFRAKHDINGAISKYKNILGKETK